MSPLCSSPRLRVSASLLLLLAGCAHYKVIDADKAVLRLKANTTFTVPRDGWFIPDARWLEMRQAIQDRIEEEEVQSPKSKVQSPEP